MAQIAHTPGPWQAVVTTEKVQDTVVDSNGDSICQLHNGALNFKADEMPANAALIAAAPDMLDALKAAYDTMNYMGDILNEMDAVLPEDEAKTKAAFEMVEAAIAKATNTELSK